MSDPNLNRYAPDSVTPPGFYIRERLEEVGMTEADLATALGLAAVSEIVTGRAPILPEVALRLALVLGIPARFWNNAERQYRDSLRRNGGVGDGHL
jgi:HTH-type transcriptional regulator/antitoxin HigA